jgi:hypothetical protein
MPQFGLVGHQVQLDQQATGHGEGQDRLGLPFHPWGRARRVRDPSGTRPAITTSV